jgi:hypothetical protein
MQELAPLLKNGVVGDFLGQGMFENIFHFGKCRLFVEKLFVLKRGEQAVDFIFGSGDHLTNQTHGKLATDYCQLLKQRFIIRDKTVDTSG